MLLACYAVPQAAVQVGKMGRHFIGVVKTGHGLFPKAFLKSHLVHAQLGAQPGLLGAPPPLRRDRHPPPEARPRRLGRHTPSPPPRLPPVDSHPRS